MKVGCLCLLHRVTSAAQNDRDCQSLPDDADMAWSPFGSVAKKSSILAVPCSFMTRSTTAPTASSMLVLLQSMLDADGAVSDNVMESCRGLSIVYESEMSVTVAQSDQCSSKRHRLAIRTLCP